MSATHKLAAILFSDIQGYTALMQQDENHANLIRQKFKTTLEKKVVLHKGRVVKMSGDGALCIFNSSIDAVKAAIEVQKEMQQDPKVPLRIGIHTGDVMIESSDVHGDGVNVASRIEALAIAGGVYISDRVYADIKNQKDIEVVFLGKYTLKNVSGPNEIFAICNEGLAIPQNKMKVKGKSKIDTGNKIRPGKILIAAGVILILLTGIIFRKNIFHSTLVETAEAKSIAVLPFANLSSNKDDEYFTDGMCDEILTHISKIAELKVISRTSVLQYKNTSKNLRQIAQELGVNTVLEGTVQKINDRVRINVQLINAKTDEHIWAEKYDRDLKDVFAIQSEVAMQIARELEAKFTDKEKIQIEKIPTNNLDAYNLYIKANALFEEAGFTQDTTKGNVAISIMEHALELDSNFTLAWCKLSEMHGFFMFGLPDLSNRRKSSREALDKAISLEPDLAEVHLSKGMYSYHVDHNLHDAIREFDIALKDFPNNSTLLNYKGLVLRRQGKWKEALNSIDKAFELSPREILISMTRLDLQFAVCNYSEVSRTLEHAKSIGINANLYYNNKVQLTLLTGTLQDARIVFDEGRTKTGDGASTMTYRYRLYHLEGRDSEAIKLMLPYVDSTVFNAVDLGSVYLSLNDKVNTRKYFEKGKAEWEKMVSKYPDNYIATCFLGLVYAGLGKNEMAIRTLKKAELLIPVENDAVEGLFAHLFLAFSYAIMNNKDEAFAELNFLQQHPGYYSANDPYSMVKIDPIWNNLRSDPRFEELWEGNALKPKFKI